MNYSQPFHHMDSPDSERKRIRTLKPENNNRRSAFGQAETRKRQQYRMVFCVTAQKKGTLHVLNKSTETIRSELSFCR